MSRRLRRLRRLAAAVVAVGLLGLLLTGGASTGIIQRPIVVAVATAASAGAGVAGHTETVPGYGEQPVTCTTTAPTTVNYVTTGGTMTCVAVDPSARVTQMCIPSSGPQYGQSAAGMLCSDYAPLIAAMQKSDADAAAAAKTVPTDPTKIDFGCAPVDAMCLAEESITRQAAKWVTTSIEFVFAATSFNDTSTLWGVATGLAGFWWKIAGFVLIGGVAVGVAVSALMGNRKMMLRAVLGLVGTGAALFSSIFIVGKVLEVVDELTAPLLAYATTNGSIATTIQKLMYPTDFAKVTGEASSVGVLLSILTLALGLIMMAFVNAIRDFGLEVLIAFAPLAFSLLGTKFGGGWVKNWTAAVVALILTKPLTLGLLVLSLQGAAKIGSLYVIQALPIFIGLVMSLLMPFVAFGLFSFLGTQAAGATEAIGHRLAGHGGRALQNTKMRGGVMGLGGRPAGVSGASGAAKTSGRGTAVAKAAGVIPGFGIAAALAGSGATAAANVGRETTIQGATGPSSNGAVAKPAAISTGRFSKSSGA